MKYYYLLTQCQKARKIPYHTGLLEWWSVTSTSIENIPKNCPVCSNTSLPLSESGYFFVFFELLVLKVTDEYYYFHFKNNYASLWIFTILSTLSSRSISSTWAIKVDFAPVRNGFGLKNPIFLEPSLHRELKLFVFNQFPSQCDKFPNDSGLSPIGFKRVNGSLLSC